MYFLTYDECEAFPSKKAVDNNKFFNARYYRAIQVTSEHIVYIVEYSKQHHKISDDPSEKIFLLSIEDVIDFISRDDLGDFIISALYLSCDTRRCFHKALLISQIIKGHDSNGKTIYFYRSDEEFYFDVKHEIDCVENVINKVVLYSVY